MTLKKILCLSLSSALLLILGSCKDTKSYAELLTDETKAINVFLSDQNVILDIPADSVFVYGEDAPYYRIDEDGNVFMQVIDPGEDKKVADDTLVFFRFTRYNLSEYAVTGTLGAGAGNSENIGMGSASFRFNNYTLSTSSQWGSGIQLPLNFLGLNSHVRLVIKSQFGLTSEIAQVIPYLYDIRYLPAVSE
ncbi:MAG: DUF4827 domain-containing protein [Muribaculaceae bacterium]|nr:DUF4827 domain-containing protein [Muribaculaceae bacterium]